MEEMIAAESVEQVKENALTLGLTWSLRYATVTSVDGNVAMVIFDDSDVAIPAIMLIGGIAAGARVAILWVPPSGNYIIAAPTNSQIVSSGVDQAAVNTASTSFIPLTGSFNCGVVFIAPPSGRVVCHFRTSQAGTDCIASVQLRTGSTLGTGSIIQSALDAVARRGSGNEAGTSAIFIGLVPGDSYNAEMQHRSATGSSCFWARREVIIVPGL